MYNASETFKNLIKSSERMFIYSGTITTLEGTEYEFDGGDIKSGKIVRSISGNTLELGTVYSSELDMELYLPVSRYELYGATIEFFIQLDGADDVIPMGIFTITEANQAVDRLSIKAFDAMLKFEDVNFIISSHTDCITPYEWFSLASIACGVPLGFSENDVKGMPNGGRKMGFADVATDVQTWRDVISYLASAIGGYTYIGRDGSLYIGFYGSNVADTVPSSFRYTSNLSDFKTTYDGVYGTYKEEGVQEYVANLNTGGIVLDLGVNPFLQFTDQNNRLNALGEIIDRWNGVYYVPYDSDMPLVPTYDPGDVLAFTDNQAGEFDIGAITEITYNIGGQMHVTCSGDNPRLATAQDRFSKTVAGLETDYNNGQETGGKNFWLLNTENDANITVGNAKTLVARIDWKQTVDVQRMGFMFTCEAYLSSTAIVKILITVDDSETYEFEMTEQKSVAGRRIFNSTCGFRVTGKGSHSAKVYMKVTNSATIWSDMV